MEGCRGRRWEEPPGPPDRWTRADLLAGYNHVLAENKDLKGVVARSDKRIKKLEGDKKDLVKKAASLVDHAAGLEKELEEARRTNSALAAANLEMERRGRGRAKRDRPAAQKRKGEKGKGEKGKAFTPLSNRRKGGPKPGEEGLPTVSEFLGDPDRPVDEEYEIDQKVCPEDGVTPLSDPVGSFRQTVIDAEVRVGKIGTTKLRRWCSRCKKVHAPKSPIALPNSRFSLRMDVTLVALRVSGLPYGRARFLASSLFRLRIDEDDMVRAVRRVSKHLGPLYDEFKRQVRASGVVNVDETRWWINGAAVWLWDFVTKWTVLLVIDPSRGGEVPRRVLEGFKGTVCKDSYGATNGIGTAEQVCLQHLSREIDRTRDYRDSIKVHKK